MSYPLLRPLEALLLKWRTPVASSTVANEAVYNACADDLERVLRESGLADLLEAGQAMRETFRKSTYESRVAALKAYDAALAKVKGKSA